MTPSLEPITVQYIADGSPDLEAAKTRLGLGDQQSTIDLMGTISANDQIQDIESPDCFLIETSLGRDDWLDIIQQLDVIFPDIPILVGIAGLECEEIDIILEYENNDIIHGSLDELEPTLIQHRLKTIISREHALRGRDELLRDLSENVQDVMWVSDREKTTIEFVSSAYQEVWGRPLEELDDNPLAFLEAVHPEDRPKVREALERQREDPASYDEVYRIQRPDGEIRWIHDRAFRVSQPGVDDRIVGIARDITTRRRREEEYREAQVLLEAAIEAGDIGTWQYDVPNDEVIADAEFAKQFGVDPEEVKEGASIEKFFDGIHPADRERVEQAVAKAIESCGTFDADGRILNAAGETRWVVARGEVQCDDDGNPETFPGVLIDITEQKEREEELERSRDLLRDTEELAQTGGWEVDVETGKQRWTPGTYAIHEVSGEFEPTLQSGLDFCHPDDREQIKEAFDRCAETGEPYDEELRLITANNRVRWIRTRGHAVHEDGEIVYIRGAIRDITERKEREQTLQQQRDELAQLDRINRLIREVDEALLEAGTREEIEQAVCERLSRAGHYKHTIVIRNPQGHRLEASASTASGQEFVEEYFPINWLTPENSPALRSLETGTHQFVQDIETDPRAEEWGEEVNSLGIRSLAMVPVIFDEREYGVIGIHAGQPNAFSEQELVVLEELGETVGHAIAAIESREREKTLRSLYEATQDLLVAEDQQTVCEQIVSTAAEVLDPNRVGIFLFDNDRNVLRPAAMTDSLIEFYGETCEFGPGRTDSAVWQAYATGEIQEIENMQATSYISEDDVTFHSGIFIPLGDLGVFVVGSTDKAVFSVDRRQLIQLLAATTESALNRVTGLSDLRRRDQEIEELVAERDQAKELLNLRRTVDETLLGARTRDEIELQVCEAVEALEGVTFAWIGDVPPDRDEVVPRTWEGSHAGYLDEVSIQVRGAEPSGKAAGGEGVQLVGNITELVQDAAWARVAVERGFQSVVAIPIKYGKTSYGHLAIYASQPEAFSDETISVVQDVGETIAAGITDIEQERGLLSDRVTELEIALTGTNTFLNAVAAAVDDKVAYRDVLPLADEDTRLVFEINQADGAEIHDIADEFVDVQSIERVDLGEKQLLRSVISGETIARDILECGGIPRKIVAEASSTTATIHIPQELDVRVFLERLGDRHWAVELRSRRVVEPEFEIRDAVRLAFEKELTDRQREVLVTAYESGFFESPRKTTGSELADLLGISQPTVTHHLREAQRRVFASMLEESVTPAVPDASPS